MRFESLAACMVAAALTLGAAHTFAAPSKSTASSADHLKFDALKRQFESGPEVTKACLSCHTEAAKQIHKTQHWKWEYVNPETSQVLGKKHVINNFCTSAQSNYAACASCHIGYGNMKDGEFDATSESMVDCLVCHDTTGRYKKQSGLGGGVLARDTEFPPGSGMTVKGLDLSYIAQRVGKTSRLTCGGCHFNGGGGDGVKHGDLDSSLEAPEKALDVHMDSEGHNFTCVTCHETQGHQVPGSRYAPTARDKGGAHVRGKNDRSNPTTCQACHGQAPHRKVAKLNDHTDKVACQTCHVPSFARGGIPTKMSWDWSTAGKRGPDGKPLVRKNAEGHVVYMGTKGDFEMAENVVPEYMWFNGRVQYTLRGDPIDQSAQPVAINRFEGRADDGRSLIWPVKVFRGRQAYDPVNKSLVVAHLAGADDTAYWTNLDWGKAVKAGMATVGAPFSGKVDFIDTVSMWPITHMVAPAKDALRCADCHRAEGRLQKVDGIYIPGRASDHAGWLDRSGWALAAFALLGVLGHGAGRIVASRRNDRSRRKS